MFAQTLLMVSRSIREMIKKFHQRKLIHCFTGYLINFHTELAERPVVAHVNLTRIGVLLVSACIRGLEKTRMLPLTFQNLASHCECKFIEHKWYLTDSSSSLFTPLSFCKVESTHI